MSTRTRKPIAAGRTLTITALAAELAARHKVDRKTAELLLRDVVGRLVQELRRGNRVDLAGLGAFQVTAKRGAAAKVVDPVAGILQRRVAKRQLAFDPAREIRHLLASLPGNPTTPPPIPRPRVTSDPTTLPPIPKPKRAR